MAALEIEGLVQRDGDDGTRYRLGPAAVALGACALRELDLRRAARPTLEALAEESGETATLEVFDGDRRMLILDEVRGCYLVTAMQEVGTLWPLHATATGRCCLASLSEDRVRSLIQPPLERFTDRTVVDIDRLMAEIDNVRRAGFAINDGEMEEGVGAAAAPVRGAFGDVLGSISVGGPLSRLGATALRELAARVVEEAQRISTALGYAGNGAVDAGPAASARRDE